MVSEGCTLHGMHVSEGIHDVNVLSVHVVVYMLMKGVHGVHSSEAYR